MIIRQISEFRGINFDQMPVSGLCFAGGVPGVVKRARYDAIVRSPGRDKFLRCTARELLPGRREAQP